MITYIALVVMSELQKNLMSHIFFPPFLLIVLCLVYFFVMILSSIEFDSKN